MSAPTSFGGAVYGTVPVQLLPGEKIFIWPDPAGPPIEVTVEEFVKLAAAKRGER